MTIPRIAVIKDKKFSKESILKNVLAYRYLDDLHKAGKIILLEDDISVEGEKMEDPLSMYLGDIYSVIANLVGIPAISIPCGKTTDGLPIGIQLVTKHLGETTLFAVAKRLEFLLNEVQIWKLDK
jgi:Asp-tRNA(Asn)/Glu-tRNA(Gln) amidotransferase A subunit family amidase